MPEIASILVVDDDVSWQENYGDMFEKAGYSVEIASTKNSALELLERRFFHVAIVDLKLSAQGTTKEGFDVLKRIWELDETLAIVSSGYAEVSMFDEFQRVGVFGFTEKSPVEIRQEFDDVFKGQFVKDSSDPKSVLDKVNKAVKQALPRSIRLRWNTSPFSLLRGISARAVQRDLKGGPMTEMRPFLLSLVQPLFPWLPNKDNILAIKDKGNNVLAFETLCWSRSMGQAKIIRFGRRDSFHESITQVPIGAQYNDAQVGVQDRMSSPDGRFIGAIYNVNNIEFNRHFNPPPQKKMNNSNH